MIQTKKFDNHLMLLIKYGKRTYKRAKRTFFNRPAFVIFGNNFQVFISERRSCWQKNNDKILLLVSCLCVCQERNYLSFILQY